MDIFLSQVFPDRCFNPLCSGIEVKASPANSHNIKWCCVFFFFAFPLSFKPFIKMHAAFYPSCVELT